MNFFFFVTANFLQFLRPSRLRGRMKGIRVLHWKREGETSPGVTDGGERYGRRRDTGEKKEALGGGEGGREGRREGGGGPSWSGERELRGKVSPSLIS